jgi:hypothetical protein
MSFLNHLIDTGSPDQVVLNSQSLWFVGFVAKLLDHLCMSTGAACFGGENRQCEHRSDCRGGSPKAEKKSIFLPGCNGCSFLRGM